MGERPALHTQNMGCTLASPDHHPPDPGSPMASERVSGRQLVLLTNGDGFRLSEQLLTKPESISSLRASPRTNEFFFKDEYLFTVKFPFNHNILADKRAHHEPYLNRQEVTIPCF